MTRHPRIGIFDSGLGGLSVLRYAPTRMKDASYLYVADTAYAPYGDQPAEKVRERSLNIALFLQQQKIDALLIACNTATALAVELIRAHSVVPVVAMEPAIKPAMAQSARRCVAVLATEATLNSERYQRLKNQHARDGQIVERACHHWVEALEQGRLNERELDKLVANELLDLQKEGADTYILACTHFPFLREHIARVLNNDEQIIDPGPAVIEQLLRVLGIEAADLPMSAPRAELFSSGDPARVAQRVGQLTGWSTRVRMLGF